MKLKSACFPRKTGLEDIDFDDDAYDTDSDIDDELDVIYRNEAIDDSMELFGFGDDGDGDGGDW